LIEALKRPAARSIAAIERVARAMEGHRPSLDPTDLRRIRNFIVPLTYPFLGVVVHETPLIEALRCAVPDANIVGAASGIAAEVNRWNPGITRLEPGPGPHSGMRDAVLQFRRIVHSFHGEPWCALFPGSKGRASVAVAMMLSGNGVRAGFALSLDLVHLPLAYDHKLSQIGNNLRVPGLLGHPTVLDLEPRVYFNDEDLDHARNLLADSQGRPLAVLITRTSGGQPTRWPDERFIAVARHLIGNHGCRVYLPGTGGDSAGLDELACRIGPEAKSLAGRTTIRQLASLCALADIAVALDTGGMHVARAQGLPLVIIAPGWQDSIDWMPLGKPWARILKGPWFPPPPPANYAIEEVDVDEVKAAVDELLRLFPPSAAAREARVKRSFV
jgi:ADP-heptose:LPS heptosyltransferase